MRAKNADANLDPTQFDLLNSEFYSADPASYFRTRMRLLFLTGGATQALAELLVVGVAFEGLTATLDADQLTEDDSREPPELPHHRVRSAGTPCRGGAASAVSGPPNGPGLPLARCPAAAGWSAFGKQLKQLTDAKRAPGQRAVSRSEPTSGGSVASAEPV